MKKYLIILAAVYLLAACTKKDEIDPTILLEDGTSVVFETWVQDITITKGTSEKGGYSLLDKNLYDLRYILELYTPEGIFLKRDQMIAKNFESAKFDLRIMPGEYDCVFWADFVEENSTEDLHYSTTSLNSVQIKDPANYKVNDDSKDAYTYVKRISVSDQPLSLPSIQLKRPFAKVKFIETEFNSLYNSAIRIRYISNIYNGYNALTKKPFGTIQPSISTSEYVGDDFDGSSQTLLWDYLFVGENENFTFSVELEDNSNNIKNVNNIRILRDNVSSVNGKLIGN